MAVSERPRSEGGTPGLGHLGLRLLAGALLMIGFLLLVQRWGEGERLDRAAFASASGTIRLAALSAPVEILRDARGIPHLSADRELDGWFGLGFVHGQDRLAQMAWLRRRAYGRSAEVIGEEALPADRLARLLEIQQASAAAAEALPESSRKVLEAYAAGVNARINRIREGRVAPPQWLLEPAESMESWAPADSLAIVKLLAWCMGGTLETTLVLDELIQRLGSVSARPFFPGGSSVDFGVAPVLPSESLVRSETRTVDMLARSQPTRALCRGIGIPSGSAWVIDGSASESGAPILVADWHLEPAIPVLFYEAQLEAGSIDVAGVTIPGSPIVWAGRNRSVAWAGVPAGAPVADLFIEALREEQGLYQNGSVWTPVEEREEILRYRDGRGALQEVPLRIRRTRHGPLIESLLDPNGPQSVVGIEDGENQRAPRALAWTGARKGDGLTSMLGVLRATGAESLVAALADHHEPVLAVAFADREGKGGVQVAGWLVKRPLPTGLVPVQGRLRSFDWRKRIPHSELPAARLGESSAKPWVIAADGPWPSRGGLDQMEWLWRPGERAARLETALGARVGEGPIDLRQAAELMDDSLAERAPRVVAAILGLARRDGRLAQEAEEIARLLERWDGSMSAASAGAAAYHLVIEHLLDHLFRDALGEALFEHYLSAPHVPAQLAVESLVLRAAKLRRAGGWTDRARVSAAARASLREAWVSLNHRLGPTRGRWAWGGLHRVRFTPLGAERLLTGPLAQALPASGDGQTLSFAWHRAGLSFDVERAAVYRVAMDLASSDQILSALTPGQSEHPGHPHFADGLGRWAVSRLPLFATSRLVIEEENVDRLLLEPAP